MRFEKAGIQAFGPFTNREIELAPGMNVLHGQNEAGKSTWHAALIAGLCGIRRGKGATRKEEKQFAEQYRPWDLDKWEVSARIRLEDGRTIDLNHDLDGKVDCRAMDVVLGRDVSSEVMWEGSPDGSRWLGLDRHTFTSTAAVRQAQLLAVLDDSEALQEHLQRAASTAGADATAAAALDAIQDFQAESVGLDRSNSRKPLRAAANRVDGARARLQEVSREHAAYESQTAAVELLDRRALETERTLNCAQATVAAAKSVGFGSRLQRIRALLARFPDGEPPHSEGEDSGRLRATAAVRSWRERSLAPELSGPTADDLQARLDQLPEAPAGETRIDPRVEAAASAWNAARLALVTHREARPPDPRSGLPAIGASQLMALADDLSAPVPVVDPILEARRQRVDELLVARVTRPWRPALIVVAALGLLAGIALALAGMTIAAVVAAVLALTAGAAFFVLDPDRHRVRDLEERHLVDIATGRQKAEADVIRSRAEDAGRRCGELNLQSDPQALRSLAGQVEEASAAVRRLETWIESESSHAARAEAAERALTSLLVEKGIGAPASGPGLDPYRQWVQANAEQARLASQRDQLLPALASRRQLEGAVATAAARSEDALSELHSVALLCSVAGDDPGTLVTGLEAWTASEVVKAAENEKLRSEWSSLQALLDGQSESDVAADAEAAAAAADRLAGFLEPDGAEADEGTVAGAQAEHDAASGEASEARGKLLAMADLLDPVTEVEEELAAAEAELRRVRGLAEVLDTTHRFLTAAQDRVHRDIAPVLAATVKEWVPLVTDGRYMDATVDPESLRVQVRAEGQRWRNAALLSQGTREQVYLLLRMALVKHLTSPGEICPLLLDEVTVQCDSVRKVAILNLLHAISAQRQVIVFTQEDDVRDWAQANLDPACDRLHLLDDSLVNA